jgi:tetratricopeptide (TPR) repeat protein
LNRSSLLRPSPLWPSLLLLIGLILVLAPTDAGATLGAQSSAVQAPRLLLRITKKQRREAKRLFNQAHLAYRRGDYEEAILKWEQSFELSREPLIFESIANAHERLGDPERALENLRKWREKAPRREHKSLDSRIENLESRIARREEERKLEQAEEAERERQEAERLGRDNDDQRRQQEEAERDAAGPSTMEILGWSLVGTGGAAVVTGVVLDIVAATTRPSEDEACSEEGGMLLCRDAMRDDIESSNQLAIVGDVLWIAGAAMAGAGVVVLLTAVDSAPGNEGDEGATAEDSSVLDAHVVPFLGPSGGGLLFTGHF